MNILKPWSLATFFFFFEEQFSDGVGYSWIDSIKAAKALRIGGVWPLTPPSENLSFLIGILTTMYGSIVYLPTWKPLKTHENQPFM